MPFIFYSNFEKVVWMGAEMGKSSKVLAAGRWVKVFLFYKDERNTKSSTNIGLRMFYKYLYLKRAKVVAISEISIQRTASSFSIKRIQNPVKNLRSNFLRYS